MQQVADWHPDLQQGSSYAMARHHAAHANSHDPARLDQPGLAHLVCEVHLEQGWCCCNALQAGVRWGALALVVRPSARAVRVRRTPAACLLSKKGH